MAKPFGGSDPLAALFHYSRDRGGTHPRGHLAGWSGILQADAYAGFNGLYAKGRAPAPLTEASCWAHGGARFFEPADLAKAMRAPMAIEAVRRIDEIFAAVRGPRRMRTVKELYATLDWLGKHQEGIERRLARRHLGSGTLVLYDVTSSYLEGRHCPLARRGYSRDGKKGKLQIVFGLICNAAGCPVAVEVFEGHCGDPATLSAPLDKLKRRFGLRRMVLVGERGLITSARIDEELRPAGFDWLTALRAPALAKLAGEEGPLQLSLFDQRGLAEIDSPDDPGERLIACRNSALAAERARKREELLAARDVELRRIQGRVRRARRPLRGAGEIGLAVGAVINRRKVAKPFEIAITDDDFHFQRKPAAIAAEAALDGIYVLRTSLSAETLDGERAVLAYKSLARVERAFRRLKTVDIEVRPIYHGISPRVRAHVFLCMLAYYLEWHMRRALAPMLFDDHQRDEAERLSPVAKAKVSPAARRKAAAKKTDDGLPVHSFRSLLAALATLTRNTVGYGKKQCMTILAKPTPTQKRALKLLDIKLVA